VQDRLPLGPDDDPKSRADDAQAGIDSVETGMRLLLALSRLGGRQTLSGIAAASGLPPPRAHRYLVSLVRAGMVERDETRGYRLGPAAVEIGVNALATIDALQLATEAMVDLRDELNQAVALMVWGHAGPVIVRAEDSNHPVSVRLRVGQPLPVISSASGIVLAAHLPWPAVRTIVESELACAVERGGAAPPSIEQVQETLAQARRRGLGRVVGTLTPGIAAIASPVFDLTGKVVVSLSVVAPSAGFDAGWNGQPALALKASCARVSARLGYRPSRAPTSAPAKTSAKPRSHSSP
jgi:DNA-binding IclR family transcriptional regulator